MNAWIVYAVGFSQIVVLYFLAMPYCLRMTYDVYLGKNLQWVADNPAFRQRYPEPKYSVWLSFLLGIAWLAFFIFELSGIHDESLQFNLIYWPVGSFVLMYCVHGIVECFRVRRKIPLPTKRSVVLQRRSLEDIVNPRWVYCGYLLLVALAGVYAVAFYDGRVTAHMMTKRALTLAVGALAGTLALMAGIRRKKQSLDEMWGPSYRKGEVLFAIAYLYLFALHGVCSVLQDLFGFPSPFLIDVSVFLSVFIQAGMFYMGRHPWPKNSATPLNPASTANG